MESPNLTAYCLNDMLGIVRLFCFDEQKKKQNGKEKRMNILKNNSRCTNENQCKNDGKRITENNITS